MLNVSWYFIPNYTPIGVEIMNCKLNLKIGEIAKLYAQGKISILVNYGDLCCECCGEKIRNSQGSVYSLDYFYQLVDIEKTWWMKE